MTKYRNVDVIVKDARIPTRKADSLESIDWSGIPQISDEVSLDSDQGYLMDVEVSWISEDKETFRGTVTHGYFPKNESEWIDEGTAVEFSRKKIARISKKR